MRFISVPLSADVFIMVKKMCFLWVDLIGMIENGNEPCMQRPKSLEWLLTGIIKNKTGKTYSSGARVSEMHCLIIHVPRWDSCSFISDNICKANRTSNIFYRGKLFSSYFVKYSPN